MGPYCVREGHAPKREVHQYHNSDRVGAALRYQKPEDIKGTGRPESEINVERAGLEAWNDLSLQRSGKRVANFGYKPQKSPQPAVCAEDVPAGWRVLPISAGERPQTAQH